MWHEEHQFGRGNPRERADYVFRTLDLRPRGVHAAGLFEPPRVTAPIATAGFAIPFHHAFPLLAVGECGPAGVYRALLSLGDWVM